MTLKIGAANTVVTKPNTPVTKPNTPVTKPNTPVTKPNTPVTKPNTPVTKPNKTNNLPPVARVGEDKVASYRKWVVLDGRKSTDPDGHIVSYQWTQIAGPKVRIDYANKNYAYAITPRTDTTLKFELTVTDDKGKSSSSVNTVVVRKGR